MNDKREKRLTELRDNSERDPQEETEFNALVALDEAEETYEQAKTPENKTALDAATKAVDEAEKTGV